MNEYKDKSKRFLKGIKVNDKKSLYQFVNPHVDLDGFYEKGTREQLYILMMIAGSLTSIVTLCMLWCMCRCCCGKAKKPVEDKATADMAQATNLVDEINAEIAAVKVMMYSKSYCPHCNMAKACLQGKGIAFEVKELD